MELTAKNISFQYTGKTGGKPVLTNISFTVTDRERVGIYAPSGHGKTTLCKLLAGYEKPADGQILLDHKPLYPYRGRCPVQLVWQHPEAAVDPWMRLRDTLAEGGPIASSLLEALGIRQEWMTRYPAELSGGELQRFCLARALGEGTRFLLADEITAMLDPVTQSQIWSILLAECTRRCIGLIVVSHSYALRGRVCTRQIDLTAM